MFFAEIILPLNLPRTFTYSVTAEERNLLQRGMRVAVPFGKNKIYTGLVTELHDREPSLYEARPIGQILDEKPIVTEIQLAHWLWIASYYMCSPGDVFRGAMPSALLLESETMISLKPDANCDPEQLSDQELLVYSALLQQSSLRVSEVMPLLNRKNVFPIIRKMMENNIISIREEVQDMYTPKLVKYIRLHRDYDAASDLQALLEVLKSAKKQKEALLGYFQLNAEKKPIAVKRLTETSGVTAAVIKGLVEKGIFEEYHIREDRVDFGDDRGDDRLLLSKAQQSTLDNIVSALEKKDVCLLHGVTASGKTEMYFRLIEKYIKEGQQVLYLLPEIALTTQLVGRLQKHFGNRVSVFHSKYSNNERVETWNRVLDNAEKAQIVIGARSALFLPFRQLGLVIIDEEHEQTFKQQDPAPRYHARDAAIVLASYHQAKVLLGSATPSLETYYNATSGKYGLAEITERFGNVLMPEIELVDIKDKYFRKRMTGHFSDTLIGHIEAALSVNEQVILFQNRRGYSPVVECLTCGHVPQCPQCDVSLTYHKFKGQLRCHYCGHHIAMPVNCHQCGSPDLTTKGFGTEQIEQELALLFPNAKTARMDQDTTRGKYSFEKLIDSFKNREIDILVGTQMLAKGLDFDNVSLVGIMNADNMLYYPDFRAFERSFQMMVQVSGRSGRSHKQGKVVIQTFNPMHNTIQQVTRNDYEGMFKEQLYERHIYKYPPYFRLIRLTLKHRDFEKLREGASWLYEVLRQNLDIPVLGPEEPSVSRIRNEYIRTIMVKMPQEKALGQTKKRIRKVLNSFETIAPYRAIKVIVNVDF
ncbi:primosomal protein N' [Flavobacterium magnum]|uniref:Replication restart protein PriA n=1 Tax=Flavobacterium magnum TaxID=2162713 RepID=A0A2S0RIZ5_9FLAO|nr:primosomal protein N' [Flavobacterium magnum]AWA31188.1 primosomal protein N' [Flavobacterium magnum]